MTASERLNVGLVGAVGRGRSFAAGFEANGARIHAVCDIQADKLEEAAQRLGADERYTDYAEMLERSDLDAVVVGTPMPLHVPQAVLALDAGLHVLSEVPAAVSIDECRQLVAAANRSDGIYMMAENYTYIKTNVLVRELARQGLFGQVYYAEGEYLHELRAMGEDTPWRRHWQTGVAGITYGTHSLGPILQWMPGDRVGRVACETSGSHYNDPRGEPYAQDSATMLCKTLQGALIKIRVDMISDRPHAMMNYQMQGTDGCYESARGGPGDIDKVWLRQLGEPPAWHDLDTLARDDGPLGNCLPDIWRDPAEAARKAGHGGGDYFEILDWVNAIQGDVACPIGIHEAMDMTLPGLVSQQSAAQGGMWLPVPDSRRWVEAPPRPQLQMVWPVSSPAPEPRVPEGYQLRQMRGTDDEAYLALMHKVGFTDWSTASLAEWRGKVLPAGFFVIEHEATGKLAATAMVSHSPREGHPFAAEIGWVGGDPAHKGKGLGRAVVAAATARALRAGYERIYLLTDDERLPALKVYLDLGYEPHLCDSGMAVRWQAVRDTLGIAPSG